jgi:hypothetical protein
VRDISTYVANVRRKMTRANGVVIVANDKSVYDTNVNTKKLFSASDGLFSFFLTPLRIENAHGTVTFR